MDFVSTGIEVVLANKLGLFFIYICKMELGWNEVGIKINISLVFYAIPKMRIQY